jgi:putative membrane protein
MMPGWTWYPLVVAMLVASFAIYTIGLAASRKRERAVIIRDREAICFYAGWLLLALALVSPLHKLGNFLFSVHMTQHELLMLVIAPLIVMGKPLIAALWAFPHGVRERVAHIINSRVFRTGWRFVSSAVFVWLAHAAALWLWHIPVLYNAAIGSELVHALQHAMFFGTAALFWWTLVHGRYGRMGYGVAILFVFTTGLHTGILGALFTLTDRVWFHIHEGRTAAWNLTALEDQQLAGLIMWIPAGVVFILIALAMLAAWMGESERRLAYSKLVDR